MDARKINMRLSVEEIDQLDRYAKGTSDQKEIAAVEDRMNSDASYRQLAKEHLALIQVVVRHGERMRVRQLLEAAHREVNAEPALAEAGTAAGSQASMISSSARQTNQKQSRRFEVGYWKLSGIAASVALISVVATFIITRSLKNEQSANYKELRRNVEQIKRSQKLMMDDIAEQKVAPAPANYAGTSFMISSNGYLTTSYHVVRESDSIFVENEAFGNLKAKVVYQDRENDIALLKIPGFVLEKSSLPYAISKKESSLAEDVFTLGYPKEDVVFGAGSISAMTGYKGNPIAYQISVPVNPGNSGGPLFNNRGDLVGIISGQQTQSSGTAFAIKSTILLASIDQAPDSIKTLIRPSRVSSQKIPSRVDQVNEWRKYVFMVRVYKEQ
ncbi:serine protease [Chryseolinea sp. T2]|uniref:S1C family serine protease n=1 Tax=Chryseolinea sp. T2 TaxID=3129255 RepID=UPI003078078F